MNVIKQIVKDGQYGTQTIKMIVKDNERGPEGPKGDTGESATIAAGQAYTVPPDSNPAVINTGTATNAVFDFYIPKGDKGETGERGPQGETGERGLPGPRGATGARGEDGAIQYIAGTGIQITDGNVIQATGAAVATWGGVQGDIDDQTDLKNALAAKQDVLTAGGGITIAGTTISANIVPDDYFTASAKVSGSGSALTLDETIGAKLASVQLDGDTTQQTYSGKNLMPLTTISIDDNTRQKNFEIDLPANTYTISFDLDSFVLGSNTSFGVLMALVDSGDTQIISTEILSINSSTTTGRKTAQFTIATAASSLHASNIRINLADYNNGARAELSNIQIETGSTATSYEPYVGGIASPNPDYPQDVNVAQGGQTIKITGKNKSPSVDDYETAWRLYHATNLTVSNNSVSCLTDATTATTGMFLSKSYYADICPELALPNYVVSVTVNVNVASRISCGFEGGMDGTLSLLDVPAGDTRVSFKTRGDLDQNIRFFILDRTGAAITVKDLQVESGTTATPYEPYQSQSYTVDLGTTELCKIGDYQDYIYKSSDDWYVHKEIGKSMLGDLTWSTDDTNQTGIYRLATSGISSTILSPTAISVPLVGKCTHYLPTTDNSAGTYGAQIGISCYTNGTVHIYDPDYNTRSSASGFTTWLQNNNVVLYYILATPTDTKITDTALIMQLNALWDAKSHIGQTNFIVTATSTNLPTILDVVAYRNSSAGVIGALGEGTPQVQANWTENDATAPDYIRNKPNLGDPTVLTSSDYNYPTGDSHDGIALWKLDVGVYYYDSGVKVYTSASDAPYNDKAEVLVVDKDSDYTIITKISNNSTISLSRVQTSNGTALLTDNKVLDSTDIVNNLTSTLTTKALSARQGKALKDTIDGLSIPTITMQTTDPGEGAILAANNFIAVYDAS